MMNLKTIAGAIFILAFLNGCTQTGGNNKLETAKNIISEVQTLLVPDKRDAVFFDRNRFY